MTLYQGGQYFLYKYKRYEDVRIAFAPHQSIAAFGGDPDNFNFPRWSLDFGLLRVYENGKPARTPDHLQWRVEGPKVGEPVFVPGHPGSTSRLLTVEQLKFQRDTSVPAFLIRNSELRGRLIQWGKTGEEPLRIIQDTLANYENSLKVYRGYQRALLDDALLAQKTSQERMLRERVAADAPLAGQVGNAWDDIAAAQARYRQIYDRYLYLESGAGFNSKLFGYARALVRGAAERSEAERAAAARVRGLESAQDRGERARDDADIPGLRAGHAVVLARQDARNAGSRRPGGPPTPEQGIA